MHDRGAVAYALMRFASAVPTLLLVIVVAFFMMHAAPGGPFDDARALPPETAANIRAAYDLDAPLSTQLGNYLKGLLRGDLGPSYRYPDYSVAELIIEALPLSLILGAASLALALAIGIPAGIATALRRNTLFDRLVTAISLTGISVPVFVIAPLLVLVFAVYLDWLPAGWSGSESAAALVLPIIALAIPHIAYIMRLVRASMIEVLASDFIRSARAQGLDERKIVMWHALRPAMMPLVSWLGPSIAAVLTGSIVVEQIFGIPGLGQRFVLAALNRDYPLVLGIVILYAALVIVLNLVVDIVYGWLDPRIRNR